MDHYEVLAKLAILDKQFKTAESIYLDNNQLDEAMQMYQELHKWDEGEREGVLTPFLCYLLYLSSLSCFCHTRAAKIVQRFMRRELDDYFLQPSN